MNKFARVSFSMLWFVAAAVVVFALLLWLAAWLWHVSAFKWIYQFAVSAGVLILGLYFLVISKGDREQRIRWGLTFLVLSPISFLLTNWIFWDEHRQKLRSFFANLPDARLPDLPALPDVSLPTHGDLPVAAIAILVMVVANTVWVMNHLPARRIIVGNVLVMASMAAFYWLWAAGK